MACLFAVNYITVLQHTQALALAIGNKSRSERRTRGAKLELGIVYKEKKELGFAQTHPGLCPRTPPPFEKGGRKLRFGLGKAQPTRGFAPGPLLGIYLGLYFFFTDYITDYIYVHLNEKKQKK